MDLPVEIQDKIISTYVNDPFTLQRIEQVCCLWWEIVSRLKQKRQDVWRPKVRC